MGAGASKAAAAAAPAAPLLDETLAADPGAGTQAPADAPFLRPMLAGIPRHIPVRLGAYELEGLIGEGAMGLVFRARQEGLRRVVALKIMRDGPRMGANARRRFLREARAMARLHHPNIVAVHEVGEFDAQPFFTMDWVDGVPLDHFVIRLNLADPVIIADLGAQIAEAVAYAHGQGIIHRDLKPANIMMDAQGRPLLTDFGLAKELDSESLVSVSGDIMGTPAFMAPEQAAGHIGATDARCDVSALGALLYWLLSRRKPFEAKTLVETLAKVVHEDPPPLMRLHPGLPH
ncbi:MAG: serine/threonine protein kinase, partial [Candidatus Marinimicrobia bacterium]|nr:serine/threonine protein kinase [Candidatus Neomarinimicrobiota bacterium]